MRIPLPSSFPYLKGIADIIYQINDLPKFECAICIEKFDDPVKCRLHVEEVHLEKNFTCSLCQMNFGGQFSFENHSKLHRSLPSGPVMEKQITTLDIYNGNYAYCKKSASTQKESMDATWKAIIRNLFTDLDMFRGHSSRHKKHRNLKRKQYCYAVHTVNRTEAVSNEYTLPGLYY